MANFLDDLSVYNAKAAAAISAAVVECNNEKANMMSSLKTTANDETLSEEIRLNALTALINLGNLLDIPLPPYFPSVTTYANTQTYTGIHNDLSGIQGGAPGDYYHLTQAQLQQALSAVTSADLTFGNIGGSYTANSSLVTAFNSKQNTLTGPGYVKMVGGVVTYDTSTFITSTTLAATVFTGQLGGTIGSPTLSNAAVISKVLTGWTTVSPGENITQADSIISALQKLSATVNNVVTNPSGVSTVALTNNASTVFTTTTTPQSGAATVSLALNTQNGNLFLASPNGANGAPVFRNIVSADLPNSGATAAQYGSSTLIPQITVDAKGRITAVTNITAASGGQVNSITLAVPSFLGLSNVDSTNPAIPQIVLQLDTQAANTVFAGPETGVDAAPDFRSLVADDIPNIAIGQVTSLQSELDSKMNYSLNGGEIWIGNASNAPTNKSLTGDVTMTRDGVVTIENEVVTFAKMQNIPTQTLLGRYTASTPGDIQQITLDPLSFSLNSGTGVLSLATPPTPILNSKGGLITYRQSIGQSVQLPAVFDGNILLTDTAEDDGLKWATMSGDATIAVSGAITIANSAVTLAKMANLAANSFIGNNTGSSATPIALTVTQATAMLNQFTTDTTGANTALKGVVPGFNINGLPFGKSLSDYFLNAAGGWSLGGGGGGGTTTNALTIGSGLSGTAGTFNGSAAVTVSLNTGNANTWTALQTFENNIYLGAAGGTSGSVRFRGSTSGYVILQVAASPANQTYILPTANGTTGQFLKLSDSGTGQLAWDTAGSGTVTSGSQYQLAYYNGAGTTTSVTGWTAPTGSRALESDANGLPVASATTATQLGYLSSATGTTGTTSTSLVFSASPTFTGTPVLSTATATSINKVAITAPATSATLTIADTKTATINNTLTFTGTDGSSVAFGAGGTVAYVGLANTWTAGIKQTFAPSATTAGINVGTLAGQPSSPANGDLVYNSSATALQAYINGAWVSLGSGSGTVNAANQYSIPYYSTAGSATVLSGLIPDIGTNGSKFLSQVITAGVAAAPVWVNSTGASSVVLRDSSQNISVNNVNAGTTTTATSGQTIALTVASSFVQVATGTTGNIFFNLPDATTLPIGATFQFNNNTTSGSVSIRNFTIGTVVYTLPAGGAVQVILTSNSTSDGVWDAFVYIPKNVTWGTSTLTATGTDAIFKSLTSGVASTTAGTLVLRNAVSAATQTIRGTDPTTSIIYDLPTTAPTAGQVLSAGLPSGSPLVSTLSWIPGGGDVTSNITTSTQGNLAVFADTLGKTITQGVSASLSGGALSLGVAGTTTGSVTFAHSSTTGTTTIQAAANPLTAALTYVLPTAIGSATNVLAIQSVTGGTTAQLQWSSTGTGDITKAGTGQVVTGDITFRSTGSALAGLVLRNSAATYGTTFNMLSTGTASLNYILNIPAANDTVALLAQGQTFSGANSFTGGVTIGTSALSVTSNATFSGTAAVSTTPSVTINASAGSVTNAALSVGAASTAAFIEFSNLTYSAAPAISVARSAGTKVIIGKTYLAASSLTDYAIGLNTASNEMWLSAPSTAYSVSFYGGSTKLGRFTGNGLTLDAAASASVGNLVMVPATGTRGSYIDFGTTGSGAPATARSEGTKIVIANTVSGAGSRSDYGIGYNSSLSEMWLSAENTSASISFYGGATRIAFFGGGAGVGLTLGDAQNIVFNTTTGTKIATATTQKLAFWNKTPIVQPTTAITGAAFVQVNTTTAVSTASTFGGYTLDKVVAALINTGILA